MAIEHTLIARSLKAQGVEHMFGIVGFPVQPIAAALRRGPIDVVRTGAIADGTVDITGADLHLRAPAMRLLLLPFGADESAKPRESGVKAEKRR